MEDIRLVTIYVDKNENLLAIPCGRSDDGYMRSIDIVNELKFPYTNEQLTNFLTKSMEQCFTLKAEMADITILEKFLGIKGEIRAAKGKRLVKFRWFKDTGYEMCPVERNRGGFAIWQGFQIGRSIDEKKLAESFKQALELSKEV